MSITLTTDPIMTVGDVKELIHEASDVECKLLINAVSAKFLRYTSRKRINQGSITEWSFGGLRKIYLHGSPVDVTEEITVEIYGTDGTVATTLTQTAGDLRAVNSDVDCYIELISYIPPWVEGIDTVKITYTGGWGEVPGDIVLAGLDQMRVERQRRDGQVGAMSVSADGQTVRFETSGLIKSVQDAFDPYRMMV